MAYLAIKKVKGRFYAYLQESYRDGGTVKTRTVEYLGAVEPAIASQVQETRGKLGKMEQEALVASVKAQISKTTKTAPKPKKPAQRPNSRLLEAVKAEEALEPSEQERFAPYQGQILDLKTGELKPDPKFVITTDKASAKPLRPFDQALSLPKDLAKHKLSLAALKAVRGKFGHRLKQREINPAFMPDIQIKYGTPDKLVRNRDGSYTIQTKRDPRRKATINKTKLWEHYRQALSSAYLDAIKEAKPELYNEMESILSGLQAENMKFALKAYSHAQTPIARFMLSLQLSIWRHLSAPTNKRATPSDYGALDFGKQDWRSETVTILAGVQKSGWSGFDNLASNSERRLKSSLRDKRDQLSKAKLLDRLSGKRRTLIKDIQAIEAKRQSAKLLRARFEALKAITDFH